MIDFALINKATIAKSLLQPILNNFEDRFSLRLRFNTQNISRWLSQIGQKGNVLSLNLHKYLRKVFLFQIGATIFFGG